MKYKVATGIMIILFLSSILSVTFNIQLAGTEPTTWTVDDDGPADFDTIQEAIDAAVDGDTIYVKEGIYYGQIVVNKTVSIIGENKNATIIDGNENGTVVYVIADTVTIMSFTVRNSGPTIGWPYASGIKLNGTQNCNIENNILTQNSVGLLVMSNDSVIRNNVISFSTYGIILWDRSNTLRDNQLANNSYNFGVIDHFVQDIDTSNTVNGKPIYYLVDQTDLVINPSTFPEIGYLALINCANITVKDLNLSNNRDGLLLAFTTGSTIEHLRVSSNYLGIRLWWSTNNIVNCNIATNNSIGICVTAVSENNLISNNTATNNDHGIYLASASHHNVFINNQLRKNFQGIYLVGCGTNNTIVENEISDNQRGIYGDSSPFGKTSIYHNSFVNNTDQALPIGNSVNVWDDGYPSGGNYWSNHNPPDFYSGPYQNETGSDRMGDKPYVIDENNEDRYPLIYPYGYVPSPDVNDDGIVDIFDVVTVAKAFGCIPGDPDWNPMTDINGSTIEDIDEIIDIFDIVTIAKDFGKTA